MKLPDSAAIPKCFKLGHAHKSTSFPARKITAFSFSPAASSTMAKSFLRFAVRLNPDTKIYEPEPDFDIEALREHVTGVKKKQGFTVEMVRELVKFPGELEIGPLGRLIEEKLGCKRSRSQELVHEAQKAKVFRYNRTTETFSKVRGARN